MFSAPSRQLDGLGVTRSTLYVCNVRVRVQNCCVVPLIEGLQGEQNKPTKLSSHLKLQYRERFEKSSIKSDTVVL